MPPGTATGTGTAGDLHGAPWKLYGFRIAGLNGDWGYLEMGGAKAGDRLGSLCIAVCSPTGVL